MIPYGRQSISMEDINAAVDVLKSDALTQGPAVERFEKAVADYCCAPYAVAVNSATSALHIACLAAGLGPGDLLWTSPNSFVSSANCGRFCGAQVDFVDIDPRTYNMSVEVLKTKLARAARIGKLPRVLIPVHFAGQSCEMGTIAALAKQHGITIIEDAAHALGGQYHEGNIGNCAFSDMTIFSFHPVKIITTGEGGMILTNRKDLCEKLTRLRSHCITRDSALMEGESHGPWYYQQIDLGFNYRMNDIQAALGTSQMGRLEQFIARRRALANRYDKAFKELPLTLPWQHQDARSAWHLYVVRLKLDLITKTRALVFSELRAAGIQAHVHYIPVHTQPYYRRMGFRTGDFPEAERYYEEALTLPLYFELSNIDQDRVIGAVREALR